MSPSQAGGWPRLLLLQGITAALYFTLGASSFLFALPPFYISVVWGASGAALAMVLVYGARVIPGAIVGAMLTNVVISRDVFGMPVGEPVVLALTVLLSFGVGLHLWMTQWLLRRCVALDRLESAREITLFVLIAGPLGSALGTTLGSLGYVLGGGLDMVGYWVRWLNWWLCDTAGILLLTPILYTLLRRADLGRRRALQVGVPLLVMLVVLSGMYYYIRQQENVVLHDSIARQSDLMVETIGQFMQGQQDVARVIRAHFEVGEEVERGAFEYFSQTLLTGNQAIAGISWHPRVDAARRQSFERDSELEFGVRSTIRRVDGAGQASAVGEQDVYYPLHYVISRWSGEHNRNVDWASTRGLGAFLSKALVERQPVLTPPLDFQSSHLDEDTFLLLLVPVLDHCGDQPLQLNSACVRGFVSVLLSAEDVRRHAWRDLDVNTFQITVRDRVTQMPVVSVGSQWVVAEAFHHQGFVDVVDRQWQVDIRPSVRRTLLRSQETWLLLGLLMFSGGLLAWVLLFGSGRGAYFQAEVAARTAELEQALASAQARAMGYGAALGQLVEQWRQELRHWQRCLYRLQADEEAARLAAGGWLDDLAADIPRRQKALETWQWLLSLDMPASAEEEPGEPLDLAALVTMVVSRMEPELHGRPLHLALPAQALVGGEAGPLLAVLDTLFRDALGRAGEWPLSVQLEPCAEQGRAGYALHFQARGETCLAAEVDSARLLALLSEVDEDVDMDRLRNELCALWVARLGGALWVRPEAGASRVSLWLPMLSGSC